MAEEDGKNKLERDFEASDWPDNSSYHDESSDKSPEEAEASQREALRLAAEEGAATEGVAVEAKDSEINAGVDLGSAGDPDSAPSKSKKKG